MHRRAGVIPTPPLFSYQGNLCQVKRDSWARISSDGTAAAMHTPTPPHNAVKHQDVGKRATALCKASASAAACRSWLAGSQHFLGYIQVNLREPRVLPAAAFASAPHRTSPQESLESECSFPRHTTWRRLQSERERCFSRAHQSTPGHCTISAGRNSCIPCFRLPD